MRSCLIRVLIVLVALASITGVAYYFNTQDKPLPIFKPSQINPELVDDEALKSSKHRISSFSLTNQFGNISSDKDLEGKIYVADFFFTTCQTICPRMSSQMHRVAQAYREEEMVALRSFSVIPEEDTPEVLMAYGESYGIDHDQWHLITGDKTVIYDLARKSYFTLKKAEVGQGDGGTSDFIHTNNFVLVDWKKRIRGYYDGTSEEDVGRLIEDIENLLKEKKRLNQ